MKSGRKSLRMPGYDYRNPDAYFFTSCTYNRECLFGEIRGGRMERNPHGDIVWNCWHELPRHFNNVMLDAFVVMPNHVHGIFWIVDKFVGDLPSVGMMHASSLRERIRYFQSPIPGAFPACGPLPGSVGAIVGSFKSASTRLINKSRNCPGAFLWQSNFHEQIIRTQPSLERIRRYIQLNPLNWGRDQHYPRWT